MILSSDDINVSWEKNSVILSRLSNAGLKLDPEKCDFSKNEIKYLGLNIEAKKGIKIDNRKKRNNIIETTERYQRCAGLLSSRKLLSELRKNFAGLTAPL